MIVELTDTEYKDTMTLGMINVTESAEPAFDIWPFVEILNSKQIVHSYTFKNKLIEAVYRNKTNTFDHVLLPTPDANIFIVIVVDLLNKTVKGYRQLNLNAEYGWS